MIFDLTKALYNYRKVDKFIYYLIAAEFCIKCIDAIFYILFNYYLHRLNYTDSEIGEIIANRYAAVFLLAIPMGLLFKGRELKPLFYITAFTLPILSWIVLHGVETHQVTLVKWAIRLWGGSFLLLAVGGLPFIILNANRKTQSEAISLYFQAGGLSVFFCGVVNTLLHKINPEFFDERTVMLLFICFGFLSIFFVYKMKVTEHPTGAVPIEEVFNGYDWLAILTVSIPTLLIALGAGFTIPFLNLFFMNVHGLNSENFSEFTSLAYVLSSMGLLYMPSLKRNIGYQSSIVIFQGLAIFSLIMMVTTEWYKTLPIALPVAVFFFVIRQPLMNVVSPITSELSMRYVGVGSREMISSINASIWSGSWFISGIVFSILRQYNISYSYIFLLTALLYALGTVWYVILIKRMKKVSAE